MPELRLTLLIAGLVFLVGLAWWELRRPRQARGSDFVRDAPEPQDMPALELPRMSARDPAAQVPVVELESATDPAAPLGTGGVEGLLAELGASLHPDPPISDLDDDPETLLTPDAAVAAPTTEPADLPDVSGEPAVPVAPAAPVVDWPAADAGQVVAVRLVCAGEKFSGRAVRLALAAEGFVLGRYAIFHKAAEDGRALLSVAGLNKPGTFDPDSIDLQRYGGLNLFTVLPGPLPGPEAVDELLACAQVLSQRLRGVLQDEHGEPLSPARTAVMRDLAATSPP
jgi:ZipA, C-terminal FtsZ-binding domain